MVGRLIRKDLKISLLIIQLVSVDVMNNLPFSKFATQLLLCYPAMNQIPGIGKTTVSSLIDVCFSAFRKALFLIVVMSFSIGLIRTSRPAKAGWGIRRDRNPE